MVWVLEIDDEIIDINNGDMDNFYLFETEEKARSYAIENLAWCKVQKPVEHCDYWIYSKEVM